ncbi:MAG: tetratricopeptide repeat protein [Planctomycetota bacterium]
MIAPPAVKSALIAGDWQEALIQIDKLRREGRTSDTLTYLAGHARQRSGDPEGAIAEWTELEESHPESGWIHKARFARAEALRATGRFEEAEAIWEQEAERLMSEGRKAELAERLFEHAERLSAEPDPARPGKTTPDLRAAAELYRQALELGAGREVRERALYRQAECLIRLQDWTAATSVLEQYLMDFDPDRDPRRARGRFVFAARLELARVQLAMQRAEEARRLYSDLARAIEEARKNGDPPAEDAPERDAIRATAMYEIAQTHDRDKLAEALSAIAALRRFLDAYPADERAPDAAYSVAERYLALGRHEDALDALDALISQQGIRVSSERARERMAELERRAVFDRAKIFLSQKRFPEAIAEFTSYVNRFPNGSQWAEAQRGILEAEYLSGAAAMEEGDFAGARAAWTTFLEKHPLDERVTEIAYQLGRSWAAEAEALEPGDPRREELYREAITRWRRVVSKYPGSEVASKALFSIGRAQEQVLEELAAAIATYRECSFGGYRDDAARALQRMTEPSLAIAPSRVFRTDQVPEIRLQVRNVEQVSVHRYALDLGEYFSERRSILGVGDLDLDLIAPDETREVTIEDYEAYRAFEQAISIPIDGPGVSIVAVTAGRFRATTLVVKSDLELILKSSRQELFVFAENLRKIEPASGVRLLVSLPDSVVEEGEPSLFEGQTDEDGVFRFEHEGLASAADIRVLAMSPLGIASNGLSLRGLKLATSLQPKGYLTTDRPVYRPGQTVHLRAVVRDARDGQYVLEPAKRYTMSVLDSEGRAIHEEELPLSEFGTLAFDVSLDRHATLGRYQVTCRSAAGPPFTGSFEVKEYQLRQIELALRTERSVYYRGERIQGTVDASFYYGAPVREAGLVIQLPDGRQLDVRTDASGRATFEYDTKKHAETTQLSFRAILPAEGIQVTQSVLLAARGFGIALDTSRELYLSEEPFAVTVRTRAPDGEPVARSLTLSVLRRKSTGDRWSEVQVDSFAMSTDESGVAHRQVRIEKGGQYILRVEGTDRFSSPVSGQCAITISDASDPVRLRWVTESQRLRVGEPHALTLHNRGAAGLALITFEGETIFDYRILALEPGANRVEIEPGSEHFPNFVLAAASMQGDELFEASVDLEAMRKLDVTITPERRVYAPGEEVVLDLMARDQLGRPVRAELSVGVIDQALLAVHPDVTPEISGFFEAGTRRSVRFRTTATNTFLFRGSTRQIAQEILAERDRLAEREKREERLKEIQKEARALAALGYVGDEADDGPDSFGLRLPQEAEDEDFEGQVINDVIGVGGGAGGKLGGRFGGRLARRDDTIRTDTREAAFWSPSVVTGEDGRAQVRFRLPETATRWRVLSRGVTPQTLVGQSDTDIVTRQDFFVELQRPAMLVEGDRTAFSARIHNATSGSGEVSLELEATGGARPLTGRRRVHVEPDSITEVVFEASREIPRADELSVTLRARGELAGAERADAVTRKIPVRSPAIPLASSRSGRLQGGEETFSLNLEDADLDRLEIEVGIAGRDLLFREALGLGALPGRHPAPGTQADVAGELLGVSRVLMEPGDETPLLRRQLLERARGLLAKLVVAQLEEGGWSWHGRGGSSDAATSALALWALSDARRAGLGVPNGSFARAKNYLRGQRTQAEAQDRKALILFALARSGEGDFGTANRLYRLRNTLSPAALAYTGLTLVELDRAPMARELMTLLAQRLQRRSGRPGCTWPLESNDAWTRRSVEMNALAVLAFEASGFASDEVSAAQEELWASRPWRPGKEKGLALAAASAITRNRRELTDARVEVLVGGEVVDSIRLSRERSHHRIERSAASAATDGAMAISLRMAGRGDVHFAARLTGHSEVVEAIESPDLAITRARLVAGLPQLEGRELPAGFGIVATPGERFENVVTQIPRGDRARLELAVLRQDARRGTAAGDDYLVAEVPIPAGVLVLEDSLDERLGRQGASWEAEDGLIRIFLAPDRSQLTLQLDLVGRLIGRYQWPPIVVRSSYDPDRIAVQPMPSLDVLPSEVESVDRYRPTPDELFARGSRAFELGRFELAYEMLTPLAEEWFEDLRADVQRELIRQLFFIAIAREDAPGIVESFEILKERAPDLTIPFDQILVVGEAYRQMKELDRATLVFRAAIAETFGRDLKVPGALSSQQELLGSFRSLRRLWLEYPDMPEVVQAYLALSDQIASAIPDASSDPKLRAEGVDGPLLLLETIRVLSRFLTLYSDDPLADEAGLGLVSAYLRLQDYETAAALAERLSARVRQERFLDHFQYAQAVAEWYQGDFDRAISLAGRVAESTSTDSAGVRRPSENRELALYILGQIHHALQRPKEAIGYYEQVKDAFADARQAIAYFREKHLALEEVVTARPGESVVLPIRYRNVESATLLAYPVDLMTLYLREKNLSQVTDIHLAGIRPAFQTKVSLGDGLDYTSRSKDLELDLEEAGAYLVIVRAGDEQASGLVLVSPLDIEVSEDSVSGRVRVVAQNRVTGRLERDVDVKVIGSGNSGFVSGQTDPRGLFVADGIVGRATVIVRAGSDHYAFHRGERDLAQSQNNRGERPADAEGEPSYFRNIFRENEKRQQERRALLRREMEKERAGIRVQQAK